jgi:CheY-like chemotaxis protein|tara:strand:+ start:1109 stop:1366 length:258 start_codon:yes stop_codon:yes gene_type:complete
LIFVDTMMPVMDGIGLIAELQKNRRTKDIPVVLITAVSTPDVTLWAIESGGEHCLTKPSEQGELDYVVEQAIGLKNGEQDVPASR